MMKVYIMSLIGTIYTASNNWESQRYDKKKTSNTILNINSEYMIISILY